MRYIIMTLFEYVFNYITVNNINIDDLNIGECKEILNHYELSKIYYVFIECST